VEEIQRFYNPKDTQYATHSFHSYPGKFVPQIVRALIKEYTEENDTILDPFCGSGTSLLEANLLKRYAIGLELNPLGCLISNVKTTALDTRELRKATQILMREFKQKQKKLTLQDFIPEINKDIPDFSNRTKWFNPNVLRELTILKKIIRKIDDNNIRNFHLLAFSSTVKEASNSSSLYRLTFSNNKKIFPTLHVFYVFEKIISRMTFIMDIHNKIICSERTKTLKQDARSGFNFKKVDCIITNPPSFNFDFARSFKIHLWWLDEDVNLVDKKLIGTKRVKENITYLSIDWIDNLILELKKVRETTARALSKYFRDIEKVFQNSYRVLKEGRYCCVRANSFILLNTQIDIPRIFTELAERSGFRLMKRIKRNIPRKAFIFAKEDRTEEYLLFIK
jgi:site-specific DNA-methyltransferase (cytosine-N4-specific)